MFLKTGDNVVIMHPYRHTGIQGKRKQSGTNERKHKTIKMLIVFYGSNMWRGLSAGLTQEPPPTWTAIASAVRVLEECYCAVLQRKNILGVIFEIFFSLHYSCCKGSYSRWTTASRVCTRITTRSFD